MKLYFLHQLTEHHDKLSIRCNDDNERKSEDVNVLEDIYRNQLNTTDTDTLFLDNDSPCNTSNFLDSMKIWVVENENEKQSEYITFQ